MNGQLFQCLDSEGESYGLLLVEAANVTALMLEPMWIDYWLNAEEEDYVEGFCQTLTSRGIKAERVFYEDLNLKKS